MRPKRFQNRIKTNKFELCLPTIARGAPTIFRHRSSFSATNPSLAKESSPTSTEHPMPCPSRGAALSRHSYKRRRIPVNQERCRRLFHPQRPNRFRSWLRPLQLCHPHFKAFNAGWPSRFGSHSMSSLSYFRIVCETPAIHPIRPCHGLFSPGRRERAHGQFVAFTGRVVRVPLR